MLKQRGVEEHERKQWHTYNVKFAQQELKGAEYDTWLSLKISNEGDNPPTPFAWCDGSVAGLGYCDCAQCRVELVQTPSTDWEAPHPVPSALSSALVPSLFARLALSVKRLAPPQLLDVWSSRRLSRD